MFHTIAVDDEQAALNRLARIASGEKRLVLDKTFFYAEDALAYAREHPVDLAFLDIEMADMDGLELAEKLTELHPRLNVIFVTAYSQYALDAFRAHAVGYLLKPLDSAAFTEQIDLLVRRAGQAQQTLPAKLLSVRCFGQFSVYANPDSMSRVRWKTAKAEELFALLIHCQGRAKTKESLVDTLWPELEPGKAANLFRVTCTYLRSALAERGFSGLFVRENDGYKLRTGMLDCDFYRFSGDTTPFRLRDTERLLALSSLYTGEYLEGKRYDWAVGTRALLESDYIKIQLLLADRTSADGLFDAAIGPLEKILLTDPCNEEAAARIIQIRLQAGDKAAAVKAYLRHEKALREELGLTPSEKLRALLPPDPAL
jgi:two-component SAPR family response regulator